MLTRGTLHGRSLMLRSDFLSCRSTSSTKVGPLLLLHPPVATITTVPCKMDDRWTRYMERALYFPILCYIHRATLLSSHSQHWPPHKEDPLDRRVWRPSRCSPSFRHSPSTRIIFYWRTRVVITYSIIYFQLLYKRSKLSLHENSSSVLFLLLRIQLEQHCSPLTDC